MLAAIYSVQWIESTNSLIFSGTNDAIAKLKELIAGIDVPLRQVLLEMLIIETDIVDSLNFSTNVAAKFGGGNVAGAEAFLSGASTLPTSMRRQALEQYQMPPVRLTTLLYLPLFWVSLGKQLPTTGQSLQHLVVW